MAWPLSPLTVFSHEGILPRNGTFLFKFCPQVARKRYASLKFTPGWVTQDMLPWNGLCRLPPLNSTVGAAHKRYATLEWHLPP